MLIFDQRGAREQCSDELVHEQLASVLASWEHTWHECTDDVAGFTGNENWMKRIYENEVRKILYVNLLDWNEFKSCREVKEIIYCYMNTLNYTYFTGNWI